MGPNSSPNGDARLVSSERVICNHHRDCDGYEKLNCEPVTLREYLRLRGRLRTGKTALDRQR
jgi:hypothetical protein